VNRYRTGSLVALGMALGMALGIVGTLIVAPDGAPPAYNSSPSPLTAPAGAAPVASATAADVLRGWDLSRAHAYADGDAGALRSLYVAGSAAGTTDARLLRSYAGRGLRVKEMKMQILAVDVLAHSQGRWRLRVTDRLHAAVAVGDGARIALPRDEASTRVVALVLRAGIWKVASVSR